MVFISLAGENISSFGRSTKYKHFADGLFQVPGDMFLCLIQVKLPK